MPLRALAVLGMVVALGVACGGDEGGSGGGGASGGGGDVTLTASNFSFQPESLTAAPGDTIAFTNEDDTEHNFTAEDAGIDEDVDPGSSTSIALADVAPGTYDFHCEYHPQQMTGTLEVTE
jgi:plastocyanin